jgi:hypothetical protein
MITPSNLFIDSKCHCLKSQLIFLSTIRPQTKSSKKSSMTEVLPSQITIVSNSERK